MQRYFLEVCYKGTNYRGFQLQENAPSIQYEVEKALNIVMRLPAGLESFGGARPGAKLAVSSRTDAGVHALQNFFHFDTDFQFINKHIYNLNALLPEDIAVKGIYPVSNGAHCRFGAISREYAYYVYQQKNPMLADRGYYYPYKPVIEKLNIVAEAIRGEANFLAFSKRKTNVKNFTCTVYESFWRAEGDCLVYHVKGNRFLRGMVRGFVGTMLKTSKAANPAEAFKAILASGDCRQADFSAPAHGLVLVSVNYKEGYYKV